MLYLNKWKLIQNYDEQVIKILNKDRISIADFPFALGSNVINHGTFFAIVFSIDQVEIT